MIKKILSLLLLFNILFVLANTNTTPKSYIIQKGTKVIYPSGKVYNVPYTMWLIKYSYGIGLRTDAELWIKNEPIFQTKLTNREALIANLNLQLNNIQLRYDNQITINKYNLGYMETLHGIFGPPEKRISNGDWKLGVGILIGVALTIGVGFVWGYAIKYK